MRTCVIIICQEVSSGPDPGKKNKKRKNIIFYFARSSSPLSIQMVSPEKAKNPFDIPELIHRLSRFVTVEDAIPCAVVSKAWTHHFVSALWFKIDFDAQPQFAKLSPDVVAKNGHYIRIVKNTKTFLQVSVLANAGINKLKQLHIETTASLMQHVQAYEIVFRNSLSLENLHIFTTSVSINKQSSFAHYVPVSSLVLSPSILPPASSKLKVLKIERLWLTHDGLAALLQGCPRLYDLTLTFVEFVGTPTQSFQHKGVKTFRAPFKDIFPATPTGPSLLSFFPNLTTLQAWDYRADSPISASRIIEDIDRHCPHLTNYKLEDTTGMIILDLLSIIKKDVSEIALQYEHISLEIIVAILLHAATLKSICQFLLPRGLDMGKEEVAPVSNHLLVSARFIQLIPRGCSQLKRLDFHSHEMDMDDVEMGEWVCKDLSLLRIRVKGLDTKDKILKAVALWRAGCWRRWREKAGTPVPKDDQGPMDLSIEARVARHLLKFDKLWTVWLGYQDWTPI